MVDYSTLTDKELNRLIAERLGWQITHIDVARVELKRPDNTLVHDTGDGYLSPYWRESEVHWALPDYTGDLNAALEIVSEYDGFTLERRGDAWNANIYGARGMGYADRSAARAICIAWLHWNDVSEAKAQS